MKVRMDIITKTRLWRMRNMVKFIALRHFAMTMVTMMNRVTMVIMVTMMNMMDMMSIMVDLSFLDNMLAICLIAGQQKFSYGLFQLHIFFCALGLNWKARRTFWDCSKKIPFPPFPWKVVEPVDELTEWGRGG